MTDAAERAAFLVLARHARREPQVYAELAEEAGTALPLLDEDLGLLGRAELSDTIESVRRWHRNGVELLTVLDRGYPDNLRSVHDRPPYVFVAGRLTPRDGRSIAVIGSRSASQKGLDAAARIARQLVSRGFTVISGLAAGIDAAAHVAALEAGGRTIAVLGTGLERCYPRQHAALQARIARDCAVVSQFLPDAGPSRQSFPQRNAVMSGLALATVIVEAGPTSGARTQARRALAHGRPVILLRAVLQQQWAREIAARPGAHVVDAPSEVTDRVERLNSAGTLTA